MQTFDQLFELLHITGYLSSSKVGVIFIRCVPCANTSVDSMVKLIRAIASVKKKVFIVLSIPFVRLELFD